MCFKGAIWPPQKPKTDSYKSHISVNLFIKGITQVLKSGIHLTIHVAIATWAIVLINQLEEICKKKFLYFGFIGGPKMPLKDIYFVIYGIISDFTDKGQFQYLTNLKGPQEGTYLYTTQFLSLR